MNAVKKLFVAKYPCIYILGNVGDPGWHKVGHTIPKSTSNQSVAARIIQISRGKNKRPNAKWYPDRIAEIKNCDSKAQLVAIERIVAEEILKRGYTRQGTSEYFEAPLLEIWKIVESTLISKNIDFEVTRYAS